MILVFLGPPGCGKGTQAQVLFEKNGYKIFSAGDLLRQEIADSTSIGQEIKDVIEKGNYVPDQLIFDLVRKHVEPHLTQDIVIDGFPRTAGQAELLMGWMNQASLKVVYFEIDNAILVDRIVNRISCAHCGAIYNLKTNPPQKQGVCDNCGHTEFKKRADDDAEILKRRLQNDAEQSKPVVAFFDARGLLCKIDASKDMSTVTSQMLEIVSK